MKRFTKRAQEALAHAQTVARELGHTYIGTEHLLLGILAGKDTPPARMLAERGVDYESARKMLVSLSDTGTAGDVSASDMTPRLRAVIERAAVRVGAQEAIGTEDLLFAILEEDCAAVRILTTVGHDVNELREKLNGVIETRRSPVRPQRTEGKPSIAGAPVISRHGRDLTALAREGKLDPVFEREEETERMIHILSRRTKNNPCLIGAPGVGKTAVVEGLAIRIAEGNVPSFLENVRIVTLDIASMVAGAKYRGEFEERVRAVLDETEKNPDLILFVDEIHTIVGAGGAEGAVDASNIMKPALARGQIRLIGATTPEEYHRHIEKDSALERRFQPVNVAEPSPIRALRILKGLKDRYETHHGVLIPDETAEEAVRLSVRYLGDRYLPDKAIDVLDEACAAVKAKRCRIPPELSALENERKRARNEKERAVLDQDFEEAARVRDREREIAEKIREGREAFARENANGRPTVTKRDVSDVIEAWTKIPVPTSERDDAKRYTDLGERLGNRVIGQKEACDVVAQAIRRAYVGLRDPDRPTGSFLFVGPTGVGKTELAKALADELFGKEAFLRFDMSEYMEKHSVSKLIGSPPGYVGYGEGGQLTEAVRRRPYAVVLFDEIEKAHPDVFHLLLQILDDGVLTDSDGRHVSFCNTVVILTSNVGAARIASPHRTGFLPDEGGEKENEKIRESVEYAMRDVFPPEFLGRLDEIVVFRRLDQSDLERIGNAMLDEVRARLKGLGIGIVFDPSFTKRLVSDGYDRRYGARPMRRQITRGIENELSDAILSGSLAPGDTVFVSADGSLRLDKYPMGESFPPISPENQSRHGRQDQGN